MRANKKLKLIIIACIFILAAFLRMSRLDLAEFKLDECTASLSAQDIANGTNFPSVGLKSSRVVHAPPFFMYLLAIPFLFSGDPVFATFFIAILNVIGVIFCYFFCLKLFDKEIALISTLLFSISAWAVLFSRKIWPQCTFILFNLAFLYSFYLVLCKPKSKAILPCILLWALLPGFHLSAVNIIAFFFVVLFIVRPKINWGYLILGIIIILTIYFPYIRHEFLYGQDAWINLIKGKTFFDSAGISNSLKIIAYEGFNSYIGLPKDNFILGKLLIIGLKILFLAGLTQLLIKAKEDFGINKKFPFFYIRFNLPYLLVFLWYVIPVFLMCTKNMGDEPFYFVILYPAQFIIVALGFKYFIELLTRKEEINLFVLIFLFFIFFAKAPFLTLSFVVLLTTFNLSQLFKKIKWTGKSILYIVLFAVVFYELSTINSAFRQINSNGGTPGDYGVCIKHQKDAAKYIINDAGNKYKTYRLRSYCENKLRYWDFLKPENEYIFIKHAKELERDRKSVV